MGRKPLWEWQPWFAWRPVRFTDGLDMWRLTWLRRIQRRKDRWGMWCYRNA